MSRAGQEQNTAINPGTKPKKRRGGSWKPGQSGNPTGLTSETRAKRQAIAAALDEAFTVKEIVDGKEVTKDLLVEAIKLGVQQGEPSLVRLACEYRYGKPVQPVEDVTDPGASRTRQLLAQLPEALVVLGEGLPQ
jgi:hypothetical protein